MNARLTAAILLSAGIACAEVDMPPHYHFSNVKMFNGWDEKLVEGDMIVEGNNIIEVSDLSDVLPLSGLISNRSNSDTQ